MNALTLTMIISMLLAMGASGNPDAAMKRQQEETLAAAKDKNGGTLWGTLIGGATAAGNNLNHNETFVRDLAPNQQTNSWSVLLNSEPAVTVGSLLSQFLIYRVGGGCAGDGTLDIWRFAEGNGCWSRGLQAIRGRLCSDDCPERGDLCCVFD